MRANSLFTKHTGGAYTSRLNEQTHLITTSGIKEALIKEGVDASAIEILLYFDYVSISDDLPTRKWDSKPKPNTVSSPWLELTETVTDSGEKKMVIRIDAIYARLIYDLFSERSFSKSNSNGFLAKFKIVSHESKNHYSRFGLEIGDRFTENYDDFLLYRKLQAKITFLFRL